MRVYIPDMKEFFTWMEASGYRYAVLRGFLSFERAFPAPGSKNDVDMLVADAAIGPIHERYGQNKRRSGVKCDVYDVTGHAKGAFLGCPYFPASLANAVLDNRRLWKGLFYVPGALDHLNSLLYHIAYQKAETSGIHFDDPEKSRASKYLGELDGLAEELGFALPYTLISFHDYLAKVSCRIAYPCLVKYLQNDFSRHRKSYFLAKVCDEERGELNLFVIRQVAVEKQAQSELIAALRQQYQILMVKDIPWFIRLTRSHKMRGGKWKRGGKPHIAVVVYDPTPMPSSPEDQKIHPFVFNSRQFMKRDLRAWFAEKTDTRIKDNPLHSTDNEAEAVGHFPLFFSAHEQEDIFARLAQLRAGGRGNPEPMSADVA